MTILLVQEERCFDSRNINVLGNYPKKLHSLTCNSMESDSNANIPQFTPDRHIYQLRLKEKTTIGNKFISDSENNIYNTTAGTDIMFSGKRSRYFDQLLNLKTMRSSQIVPNYANWFRFTEYLTFEEIYESTSAIWNHRP